MSDELVNLPGHIIKWVSVSGWEDIPGGAVRVGLAEVDERTPIFHRVGKELTYSHCHGRVFLEEGCNKSGEYWIKVVRTTNGTVLTPVDIELYKTMFPGEAVDGSVDAYSQVAE